MATMQITEYSQLATDANAHPIQVGSEPALVRSLLTFTTTTQSVVFNGKTRFIRIVSDTDGYVNFGLNPTATTATDTLVKADSEQFFGVVAGQRLAAVT